MNKEFPISSLTREDMLEYFKKEQVEKLTDEDMEELARNLGEDYTNDLFWESLKILGQDSIEAHEIEEVINTPKEKLPLLIGSLDTNAGKAELACKLKA